MIKAIIVEDELPARETLNSYLERYFPNVSVKAETDSIKDTVELLNTKQFDVVFLDIQLTDGLGLEVLQNVKSVLPRVIFTTAHDNFTQEAFHYKAFGYLLKPLDPNDFKDIMNRVVKDIMFKDQSSRYIKVPNKTGNSSIDVNEIIRCEAESNYTKIITIKHEQFIIAKTLKSMEEEVLPEELFLRTHKTHLVSIRYINKDNANYKELRTVNGDRVPISRTKRDLIKDRLLQIGIDIG
jgi:two-component system LytT family response regulator